MKDSAFENFSEGVMEAVHDFARCQRADGSFYGTGGVCRKGTQTGAKEKEAKAAKPKRDVSDSGTKSAAAQEQLRQINTQEGRGGGAGAPASASPQSEVRALDKAAKAADKKADAADKQFQKSKSPADQKAAKAADKEAKAANKAADKADKAFQSSQKLQAQTKKLSAEYERLRGDNSPKATARRKKILAAVSKNVSKQKELQKTISAQTPKKPDTSPAANQRRANAAARAKD